MKLLKTTLLTTLSFFLFSSLMAQNVSIGLRTGATYFKVRNSLIEDEAEYSLGLNVAIPVEIKFNEYLALQPELHFTQKGVLFEDQVEGEKRTLDFKTNFIEIPVLFKMSYGPGKLRANAFLGTSANYAINRYVVQKIGDDRDRENIDFVNEGNVQDARWEFSALGGVGLSMKAGPGNIVLDARYSIGVTDDSEFEGERPKNWKTSTNRGCTLSLGYTVPLK